jgi:hypothetical protein
MIGTLKQRASVNMDRRGKCEGTIIGETSAYYMLDKGDDMETIYADELYSSVNRVIIPKLIVDIWQSASRAWYQLQPICIESAKYFSTLR